MSAEIVQLEELGDGLLTSILSDTVRTVKEECGYNLLAFVVWQRDKDGKGGYFNIIPNAGIDIDKKSLAEFFTDLQNATTLILQRLRQ